VAEARLIILKMNRRAWLGIALARALTAQQANNAFPHSARVVAIEDLTHDTKLIRFRAADPKAFGFTPGQFAMLKVPDGFIATWNERYKTSHQQVARAYSFASSPSKLPEFDLIIKLATAPPGQDVPPGLASTFVHSALKPGDHVRFSAPTGKLTLRQDTGRPILIIAGGTGAAPFVSLLEYWFEHNLERNNKITLFFGVRAHRDLFLHDRFRAWEKEGKIRYIPALSQPASGDRWQGETGFIQTTVDKYVNASSDADAYLAGPPIMIREVTKVLEAKGLTKDRIHLDQITVK
jgi:NAD(P)H-flavin reductase